MPFMYICACLEEKTFSHLPTSSPDATWRNWFVPNCEPICVMCLKCIWEEWLVPETRVACLGYLFSPGPFLSGIRQDPIMGPDDRTKPIWPSPWTSQPLLWMFHRSGRAHPPWTWMFPPSTWKKPPTTWVNPPNAPRRDKTITQKAVFENSDPKQSSSAGLTRGREGKFFVSLPYGRPRHNEISTVNDSGATMNESNA